MKNFKLNSFDAFHLECLTKIASRKKFQKIWKNLNKLSFSKLKKLKTYLNQCRIRQKL